MTEFMDLKRYGGEAYLGILANIYRIKYSKRPVESIIVSDDDAFQFILRYHDEIFPGIPVVFCGVNIFTPDMIEGRMWITGVTEFSEVEKSLDMALNLHPATKEVVAICDSTTNGQNHKLRLAQFLAQQWPNVNIRFIGENETVEEVGRNLKELGPGSIVYYSDFFVDKNGLSVEPGRVLPWFSKICQRPIYAHNEIYLGMGIVGGKLVSPYNQGYEAGRITRLILEGQAADKIPTQQSNLNEFKFDAVQMERFGIPVSALPKNSIIINKKISFWLRNYKIILPAAGFILLQSAFLILLLMNIEKRKRVEKKLSVAAQNFSMIYKHSPESMVVSTLEEGKYVEANDSFERVFGYKREEIIGKTYKQVRIWEDNREREKLVEKIKESGYVSGQEIALFRKSGEKFQAFVSAIQIDLGDQKCMLSVVLDITERKQFEETLRKSEERYALAQKAANIGSWDWDLVKGTLTWSDTMEQLFGFLPGEFTGTYERFLESVHPEDRNSVEKAVKDSLENDNEYAIEYRIVWPNGTVRWMSAAGNVMKDGSGRSFRMLGVVQDITLRKQAEEALRLKSLEVDQFFNCTLDLLCIGDKDGFFRRLNPEWEKTLGYSMQEMENKRLIDFVHPADIDATLAALTELNTKKFILNFRNRYQRKDGTYRWLEWKAFADGERFYAVARDITEHLHIQQILSENKEKYKALFGAISDAVYIFDLYDNITPGNFIEVNDEACKMLGYSKEEFMQMSIKDIDWPGSKVDAKAIFTQMLAGNMAHFENEHVTRDGKIIPVEIQARLFDFGGKLVVFSTVRDISERKQAEAALRESEERARHLSDAAFEGIMFHSEGIILDANRAFAELFWYGSPEEMIGKHSLEALHLTPESEETVKHQLRTRDNRLHELIAKSPEGEIRYIEVMGKDSVYRGRKARVVAMRDITSRKMAEQALTETENRYQELFKSMKAAVAVYQALNDGNDFIFKDMNPASEQLEKVNKSMIIGKNLTEVFPYVEKFGLLEVMRRVWRTGKAEFLPLKLYKDERISGWRENYVYKLKNGEIVTVYEDVSERKLAEEAIKESEERFRTIVDSAQDGVLGMDVMTFKFLYANPQMSNMTGYSIEELLTMEMKDLHYANMIPYVEEQIQRQVRREISTAVDIPVRRKDGSVFYADVNATTVFYKGRKTIIGFFRDMTEQKQAREELLQKNKELENYTYLVSHDLKEPIRGIHLFSQLIKKENWDQLDENGKEYLNRVLSASNRVGHMISDLLTLSRVSRKDVTLSEVDLNDVIETVKEDLSRQIEEKNALINYSKLPVIKCQRVWMTEIFKNIISNGIKYNESKRPVINITYNEHDDKHEFSIEDNGIGIPAKYHEIIFDLFRRLHSRDEYEGTGAGLAIVKSIIAQHHGSIWVKSSVPQQGTVFSFTIPKNL